MAADEAPIWYLREGSRSVGPFTIQEMKARLRVIPNWQSTYVWREGFDDWVQAESVPELHEAGPPPFKQAPKPKSIPIRIARAFVFIVGVSLFATLAKLGIRAVFQSSPLTAPVSIEELFAATVATTKPKLPQRVDDETTLVDIAANGMILTYSYKVTFDKIDFDLAGQKKWLVDHVCKNADLKDSLTKAATFRYRYIDVKSRPLGAIEITRGDCG